MPTVPVKCDGNNGEFPVPKKPDTITFNPAGKCTFATFRFWPDEPPPGFTRLPTNPNGSIPYSYNGSPIPYPPGYVYQYTTNGEVALGNGSGVIKN